MLYGLGCFDTVQTEPHCTPVVQGSKTSIPVIAHLWYALLNKLLNLISTNLYCILITPLEKVYLVPCISTLFKGHHHSHVVWAIPQQESVAAAHQY